MRRANTLVGRLLAAGTVVAMLGRAAANTESPYSIIVERNVFALKPPPSETNAPAATPPNFAAVRLTGITDILGKHLAFLETSEPGPGKTPKKLTLKVGERVDAIELLQIDFRKNSVRIRNAGMETNVTFEIAKAPDAPAAPAAGARTPQPAPPGAPAGRAVSSATVIGRDSGDKSDGVLVFGGGGDNSSGQPAAALPPQYAPNNTRFGRNAATGSSAGAGSVSIPTRPLRSNPNVSQPPPEASSAADRINQMNSAPGGAWPPPPPPLPSAPR